MHYLKYLIILLVLFFLTGSCGQKKLKVEQPPPEEIQFIAPIGKKIASNLFSTLKGELKTAMDQGGVEQAITLCNLNAIQLTDSVALNSSFHVSIKRTSDRVRNPSNAPDPYEQLALDLFNELINSGDEWPEFYIQKITGEETVQYNFYKPMKMDNLCLVCHGDNTTLAPNAMKLIDKLYPEDKATGYKLGDFRGLLRIKFYEPAL